MVQGWQKAKLTFFFWPATYLSQNSLPLQCSKPVQITSWCQTRETKKNIWNRKGTKNIIKRHFVPILFLVSYLIVITYWFYDSCKIVLQTSQISTLQDKHNASFICSKMYWKRTPPLSDCKDKYLFLLLVLFKRNIVYQRFKSNKKRRLNHQWWTAFFHYLRKVNYLR